MCADIKDRYDVDLWRRPSGVIRFPIGAWSSPIGVYSLGTPKILADYVAANFSMLEISGGALGPVDALTQWKYVTKWTQRAAAADLRVMLDTYSYASWAPWNKSTDADAGADAVAPPTLRTCSSTWARSEGERLPRSAALQRQKEEATISPPPTPRHAGTSTARGHSS